MRKLAVLAFALLSILQLCNAHSADMVEPKMSVPDSSVQALSCGSLPEGDSCIGPIDYTGQATVYTCINNRREATGHCTSRDCHQYRRCP